MTDKVSSADAFQNFEVVLRHPVNVNDALFRKLSAVQAMPKPVVSVEDILKVTLPPRAKPMALEAPQWPNQLAQSILNIATQCIAEAATPDEATPSDSDNPERRVLELGLRNLRMIIELEFIVTNGSNEVETNRLLPALLNFHNSFQELLMVLDKVIVKSRVVNKPIMFIAVSLFFLIEHSTVKVCHELDRSQSVASNNQTSVSREDNAVATVCTVAKYRLGRRGSGHAGPEKAWLAQLSRAHGKLTSFHTNAITLLICGKAEIFRLMDELLGTKADFASSSSWEELQHRLVEDNGEHLASSTEPHEVT